ncbi:MAG: dihydropteroate synthase [Candidatus Promineifilaceae bacterium]|nr:dihydropteroate synthase [Candidatus Promineifilaceae bacterium]
MSKVTFLSLGSNLGDRRQNLRHAIAALDALPGFRVWRLSPLYETAPWGKTDQPHFLNLCLLGYTTQPPDALLRDLKRVEVELGRQPAERWGPRVIDIDILFYGDEAYEDDALTIPHPHVAERPFVLAPLAALAPHHVHPESGRTVAEMLSALDPADGKDLHRLPLPLVWGRQTYVMGILNVTPDSFSGDGLLQDGDWQEDDWQSAAVAQAQRYVEAGADIIDIGGESTRPGSTPLDPAEEMARVLPIVEAVHAAVDVPISIDTYTAAVAEAALAAGAEWINDVWGLRMDPEMAAIAAEADCPVIIMHNRSRPRDVTQEVRLGGRYVGVNYDDLLKDVRRELQASVDLALEQGVAPEKIIIDPGIGFGKTVSQNVQLIDQLDQLRVMGYPILLGPSRKSFIGYTLRLPPDERVEGTAATVAIGIDRGADIVRVHDVEAMVRVARMTDRIVRRHA